MRLRGITRNVVMLGLVSFCTDLASEMLYPIIPLFVVGTLGSSPALLGLIEGLAEGISSGLRWIGGAWSDRIGRRKPFIVAGYGLSAFSKPVMGLAGLILGWPLFLLGRCSDRLGKSIRTAARDALIADSTDPAYRGAAFGFHRAFDTCGAVLGPAAALLMLQLWPQVPLMWLFFVAFLPGLGSVLLAAGAVRDIRPQPPASGLPDPVPDNPKPPAPSPQSRRPAPRPAERNATVGGRAPLARPTLWQQFPRPFWHLLIAYAVFSLGNSSDSFLILRSKEIGLSAAQVIVAYMLFNVVYAAAATPLGHLSDRIGRRPVVIAGWVAYAAVYAGFAYFEVPLAPWILLGVYGLYQALTEGVVKAMISDVVPTQQRAGAIGLLATVAGLGQLVASLLAGATWHIRLFDGQLMLALALGAACALLAIPLVATVRDSATPSSRGLQPARIVPGACISRPPRAAPRNPKTL